MNKILTVHDSNRCIGCYSCMFACARVVHHSYSPHISAVQVRTQGGLQGKLSINICRGCAEPSCLMGCSSGALQKRVGGGVALEAQLCSGCGRCAEHCPVGAITLEQGLPIICRHCGVCTEFCPHGVLSLVAAEVELC